MGIDDGIKMKGKLIENIKDYIKDIIDDNYLYEGEQIEIVRADCFMNKEGKHKNVITSIPFKYKKKDSTFEIKKNSYPLSNVLVTLNKEKVVSQMKEEDTNEYYMKYSKKIKEIFK